MESESKSINWQDWTLIALRVLYLVFMGLVLFTTPPPSGQAAYLNNEITIGLVIGVVVTILSVIPIIFPPFYSGLPILVLLGDWLMVGIFTYVSHASPMLMIANGSIIILTSVLRVGLVWGLAQTLGVLIAILAGIGAMVGFPQLGSRLSAYTIPLGIVGAVGIVVNIWAFVLRKRLDEQESRIMEVHSSRSDQLSEMQDRTRGIYEMAAALSSTLDYQRILEAAMSAGWLGLRRSKQTGSSRLASMVLLFRASDNQLHVAVGRGLARSDNEKVTAGNEGVIGDTLEQCIPIAFNGNTKRDPELSHFIAFQSMRSILCIPLRAGFDNYGVMVYGSEAPEAFVGEHTELLTAIGTQATVALQNAVLYQNLLRERDKIVEVEEEARKKLARDLHDGPTQSVAAIAMRMSIIYKMLERTPDDVPSELKKIEEIARNTTKEIRSMLFTLRPLVLENQGLTAALGQLADKMKETYDQSVSVWVAQEAEAALDTHQQGTIFYIVEEATGNARKHAKAPMINVSVNRQEDVVIVTIADNGVGFDAKAAEENAKTRGGHLGMINLQERSELLGGSLRIESAVGRGTSITVVVPIKSGVAGSQGRRPSQRVSTGETTKLEAAVQRTMGRMSG